MITKATAAAIWNAYREIETGEKLLVDLEKARAQFPRPEKNAPTLKDAFGRERHLQLRNPERRGQTPTARCQPRSVYGIKKQALANWWALLESPPVVQTAVEEGRITATVGAEIAKVEPSKQPEALEAAIAAGRGVAAREAVQRMRKPRSDGEERPQRIGIATMRQWGERLDAAETSEPSVDSHELTAAILRAILGEGPRALKDYPNVQKALRAAIKGDAA